MLFCPDHLWYQTHKLRREEADLAQKYAYHLNVVPKKEKPTHKKVLLVSGELFIRLGTAIKRQVTPPTSEQIANTV
ncbi:MAG: hypothetical protein GY796_04345 [Chloroflexi bacterium]|nr:hypothetical protein [Chloroflexota bacterium]